MVSLCFLADFKVQQLDLSKYFVRVVKEPFGNFYHYGSEGMKDKVMNDIMYYIDNKMFTRVGGVAIDLYNHCAHGQ